MISVTQNHKCARIREVQRIIQFMPHSALHILEHTFGYHSFRPHQQDIINAVSNGQDALVIMPTGGGKSLCYQLPALLMNGVAIVISPLIALMQDQVTTLRQLGVRASFLNSTLNQVQAQDVEEALLKGELDLLYIAPERLTLDKTLNLFNQIKIALFAIDEAHCVSQWGHDFRADYLQLNLLHERFPSVPRIALTATADKRTREEIIQRLDLDRAHQFIGGFNRPNIQYRVIQKNNSKEQLLDFLRAEHSRDAGIVYCLSRKKVEQIADWLNQQGFTALPYHAGLDASTREANQNRFIREESIIIVATIAFGMGIDKPDVRFVAHLDLPKSIESYYQETGRAGRDSLAATAWMSYGIEDVVKLRRMLESSQGNEEFKKVERHRLDAMLGFGEITTCRRQALLRYFGEEFDDQCGNCDNCLQTVDTWDATVAAQKALSCVYRTRQLFGVNHLLDVLLGKETKKIQQFDHHLLSTFGIGTELNETQWRSVFRQLVARGFLTVDVNGYGSLRLTEKSRSVLKGDETLMLRRDPEAPLRKKTKTGRGEISADDRLLWEALRELRKNLAVEQGVPPYVIFHDATLMEFIRYQPSDHQAMSLISGVGDAKLERYGEAFIECIQQFRSINKKVTETANTDKTTKETKIPSQQESLDLFNKGNDVNAIAGLRELKLTTVYQHLCAYIASGDLRASEVAGISAQECDQITDALIAELTDDNTIPLTQVYEHFGGAYSYDVLRCVRAEVLYQLSTEEV